MRAQYDNRYVTRGRVVLQFACRVPAVEHRQAKIHKDQIRHSIMCQRDCLTAVAREQHAIAASFQPAGQRIPARLVVFNHHDGPLVHVDHRASTAIATSTPVASRGKRTVKREPWSGTLWTVTEPFINSQKRDTRARPSPVPPYLRVVVTSACVKASKIFSVCATVIPMPVSVTVNSTKTRPASASLAIASVIEPSRVNLPALLRRLSRICRVFIKSERMTPTSRLQRTANTLLFCRTSGPTVSTSSSIISCTSKGSSVIVILPASIFDKSRMPLMSASRCCPDDWIFSRSLIDSVCRPLSSSAFSCNSSL